MVNLVLHCGARHVERRFGRSRRDAAGVRDLGSGSAPSVVGTSGIDTGGRRNAVANEAHALWSDGLRYFGLLEVTNGAAHDDYGLVIGLRNSHDKSFPASIALGSGVFVCDNLVRRVA